MEKLDEKKPTPEKVETDKIKSDLEEMKKWADDTRKKTQRTQISSSSSKAVKKPVAKPKTDSVKAKSESKPTTVSKPKPQPKTAVKKVEKQTPKAKAPAKKTVAQPAKPKSKPQKAEKKSSFDQKFKDLKQRKGKSSGGKQEHNYLLWATIAVIVIPCLIILYIIIGSRENSRNPVTGDRFDDSLDPAITEKDLSALTESLKFDQADKVEITLKSATLRVNIDTKDDLSQAEIKQLIDLAYDKVNEKLPIDTYFTNKKNGDTIMKMYDLQISAYNMIPEADAKTDTTQIHLSRTKNAAAEKPVDDVLSSPKDEQSAEEILHPDTSNPPTKETGDEKGE